MSVVDFRLFSMPKVKSRLCAFSLVGVLLSSSLMGCKSNKKIQSDITDVLLNFGGNTYSIEVLSANRNSNGYVEIILADNSKLYVNDINIITYNDNSLVMNSLVTEDDIKNIETIYSDDDFKGSNMALLLINDVVYSLEIKNYLRLSDGMIGILLQDGTLISVNEKNIIIYDGDSKIMDQVETDLKVRALIN